MALLDAYMYDQLLQLLSQSAWLKTDVPNGGGSHYFV
jgi:hypothetical protein